MIGWLIPIVAAATSFTAPPPSELDQLIQETKARPIALRVEALSARFLGMPYVDNPLGEGSGRDPDPIVRYDEADCQTFVETMIALGTARSASDATQVLQRIRYVKDAQRYEERAHFAELQWVPNAVRRGFLQDITREVAGTEAIETGMDVTAEAWAKRTMSREIDLPTENAPIGSVRFAIIPIDKVERLESKIPESTVMLVVRKAMPGYMTRVSHLGFVVHHDGKTYVRHAGSAAGRVLDEEIASFLGRHRKFTKWPVEGVWLFRVIEPPPSGADPTKPKADPALRP